MCFTTKTHVWLVKRSRGAGGGLSAWSQETLAPSEEAQPGSRKWQPDFLLVG